MAVIDTAGERRPPRSERLGLRQLHRLASTPTTTATAPTSAGTIGALDNDIGVVGVAPGARLWNIRVLRANPNGSAGGLISWVICGLDVVTQYAIPQPDGLGDIEVANASLGHTGADSNCQTDVDAFHQAYCRAVAAGVTVVVAAMNDAQDAATVVPATYAEVITVSALADSDGRAGRAWDRPPRREPDDSLATFSNFGADVNIAAPGVDILSTVPTGGLQHCNATGFGDVTAPAWPPRTSPVRPPSTWRPTRGRRPRQVKSALVNSRELTALPGDPDGIAEGVLYAGDGAAPVVTSPPPPDHQGPPPKKAKKHKKKHKNKKKR